MQSDKLPLVPLVSVIMPAYNARPYIGEAIRSVLEQDYPNLELIVVDDGSNDGTPEEARTYGERVRVFERCNGGPAAARNFGFSVARGELIAFLDADDVWMPEKLSAQVDYLQSHPEVGVVFGQFVRWVARPDGGFGLAPQPPDDPALGEPAGEYVGWIYCELLYDSIVHIITAMIRKPVLDAVGGFDERLRIGEDYDFWLRISRQFRVDMLNRSLAWYRMHPQSTTRVPRAENYGYRVVCNMLEQYGAIGPDGRRADAARLRERLFGLCFSHGYLHYWEGEATVARRAFRAAIGHDVWRLRAWVYLLLAVVKERFGFGLKW